MVMIVPSSILAPTTNTVGVFFSTLRVISDWLVPRLSLVGQRWQPLPSTGETGWLIGCLRPLTAPRLERYLLLELDGATFVFNNSARGTDLGMLPSLCARELGITAIRASLFDGESDRNATTALDVFTPDGDLPLRNRRLISLENCHGMWRFAQFGEPFDFEDSNAYESPVIEDRFTGTLLHRYLGNLGVPELPGLDHRPSRAEIVALVHD